MWHTTINAPTQGSRSDPFGFSGAGARARSNSKGRDDDDEDRDHHDTEAGGILRRLRESRERAAALAASAPTSLFELSSSLPRTGAGARARPATASAPSSVASSPARSTRATRGGGGGGDGAPPLTTAAADASPLLPSRHHSPLPPPRVFAASWSSGGGVGGVGHGHHQPLQHPRSPFRASLASSRPGAATGGGLHRRGGGWEEGRGEDPLLGSASESLRGASSMLAMTERLQKLQGELARALEEKERVKGQVCGWGCGSIVRGVLQWLVDGVTRLFLLRTMPYTHTIVICDTGGEPRGVERAAPRGGGAGAARGDGGMSVGVGWCWCVCFVIWVGDDCCTVVEAGLDC